MSNAHLTLSKELTIFKITADIEAFKRPGSTTDTQGHGSHQLAQLSSSECRALAVGKIESVPND